MMKNVWASMCVMGCMAMVIAPAWAADAASHAQAGAGSTQAGSAQAGSTQAASEAKAGMSHGEVRKVDMSAGKLTIKHGPLDNLGMGAMTMAFRVRDPAMLSQVKAGDQIDFVAEEVDGALTVVVLRKR